MTQTMTEELRALTGPRYEDVRERLKSSPDLVARGTRRLSLPQLDELNAFRLRLALASETVCKAMWSGQTDASTEATWSALNSFSELDRRAWARLMVRAALLEIDGAPAPPREDIPPEALTHVAARLSPERRDAFLLTTKQGLNASGTDACAALRELMDHARSLDDALRERTLRALAGR